MSLYRAHSMSFSQSPQNNNISSSVPIKVGLISPRVSARRSSFATTGFSPGRARDGSIPIDPLSSDSVSSYQGPMSHNSSDYDVMSIEDVVSEAGPEYIKSNLKSYNLQLINYLIQQGLNVNPLRLKQRRVRKSKGIMKFVIRSGPRNPNIETFVTSNGQILYLPFNPFKKRRHRGQNQNTNGQNNIYDDEDEDEENQEGDMDSDSAQSSIDDSNSQLGNNGATLSRTTTATTTQSELEKGHHHHTVACHTICVMVKLAKEETLDPIVRAQYHTDAKTRWIQGIPVENKKVRFKEHYRVCEDKDWDLDMRDPDCFIPFKNFTNSEGDSISDSDSSSLLTKDIVLSDSPTQKIQFYHLLDASDFVNEIEDSSKDSDATRNLFEDFPPIPAKTFEPGYYVFLLPIAFPINTPETVITPTGSVIHNFTIQINKQPYQPTLQAPQLSLSSPSHHSKFEDPSYSTQSLPKHKEKVFTPVTGKHSIGSSFLKKLSLRRQSSLKSTIKAPLAAGSSLFGELKSHTKDSSDTIYEFGYQLPVVRLPPSDATSTLNKSIYVNKVWNNSLNYEMLLPRKYIQLSPMYDVNDQFLQQHSFMLQMKLIPLIKGLCLKRIKINVVERATYISRDRKYEEDIGDMERSGVKERVVTLLEIKARDRPFRGHYPPLCSQLVKGCTNDNLLTCCYKASNFDQKANRNSTRDEDGDITITNPVKIQCPLTFTANDESHFIKSVHKNLTKGASDLKDLHDSDEFSDDAESIFSTTDLNSANYTGVHTGENTTNNDQKDFWVSKSPSLSSIINPAKSKKAFYSMTGAIESTSDLTDAEKVRIYSFFPDATFHNVKIRHRLQVCFRISKPDLDFPTPNGPKMHHYEVIVDTPICFISPFCVSDTLDLPSYDYAVRSSTFGVPLSKQDFSFTQLDSTESSLEPRLPTFEEAVLQPGSPMMTGMSNVPFNSANGINATTIVAQSPFSSPDQNSTFSSLDQAINAKASNEKNVSKGTVPDDLFAKREIKRRPSVKANSQLSIAAHRQSGSQHHFASIDSRLGENLSSMHNPSRSSLDGDKLPTYQSVIEDEISNGLQQKMSLLNVEEHHPVPTATPNDSEGDDASLDVLNTPERAHVNHVV